MKQVIDISFIIPAYNEAEYIGECIKSIHDTMKRTTIAATYEIIVGNHHSSDCTAKVAQDAGACVYFVHQVCTIGDVRNLLASKARGRIYAFIDADVRLREDWADVLFKDRLEDDLIIGSYPVGMGDSWIQRYWFQQLHRSDYVGSGHMIMTANTFDKIGGFDARLPTGEDCDLCERASAEHRVRTMVTDGLRAYHACEPSDLSQFFWREVWHGTGDWEGIKPQSELTMFSATFTLLVLVGPLLLAAGTLWGLGMLSIALLLVTILVLYKFPQQYNPFQMIVQYFLCAMYMVARTMSVFYQSGSMRRDAYEARGT